MSEETTWNLNSKAFNFDLYQPKLITPESSRHILARDYEYLFKYDKVAHDQLSHEEAKCCCHDLVEKVYEVILDLHLDGITHGDLRLPNI